MNIISTELEIGRTFHILPHLYVTMGKSVYVYLSWLNFEFCVKHISTDYKSECISLYFPSISIHRYPTSGYRYSLEICAFGYTYRKGLFRCKNKGIHPTDNTHGFVNGDWFRQFRQNVPFDFISGLKNISDEIERKLNDTKNE